MNSTLIARFYQRYFAAITAQESQSKANCLSIIPENFRMQTLEHLMQWNIESLDDEQCHQHTYIHHT